MVWCNLFLNFSVNSSVQFLNALIKASPFKIKSIQTDNGLEFIKEFREHTRGNISLFMARLSIIQPVKKRGSEKSFPLRFIFYIKIFICRFFYKIKTIR